MKTLMILSAAFGLGGFVASGCVSAPKNDELAVYQCPDCLERESWSYQGPKYGRLKVLSQGKRVKTVTHECPTCTKSWGANVSLGSTCTVCQKSELVCPLCAAASHDR